MSLRLLRIWVTKLSLLLLLLILASIDSATRLSVRVVVYGDQGHKVVVVCAAVAVVIVVVAVAVLC
jgi:hypothetical protein